MDFREAIRFLANHFPVTPTAALVDIADALVDATAPMTAEKAARLVFDSAWHPEHKIHFIKDIRNLVADSTGTPCSLKEAKDAAEEFLASYKPRLRETMNTPPPWNDWPIEDEDGTLAHMRMLENQAEARWTQADEEPF